MLRKSAYLYIFENYWIINYLTSLSPFTTLGQVRMCYWIFIKSSVLILRKTMHMQNIVFPQMFTLSMPHIECMMNIGEIKVIFHIHYIVFWERPGCYFISYFSENYQWQDMTLFPWSNISGIESLDFEHRLSQVFIIPPCLPQRPVEAYTIPIVFPNLQMITWWSS